MIDNGTELLQQIDRGRLGTTATADVPHTWVHAVATTAERHPGEFEADVVRSAAHAHRLSPDGGRWSDPRATEALVESNMRAAHREGAFDRIDAALADEERIASRRGSTDLRRLVTMGLRERYHHVDATEGSPPPEAARASRAAELRLAAERASRRFGPDTLAPLLRDPDYLALAPEVVGGVVRERLEPGAANVREIFYSIPVAAMYAKAVRSLDPGAADEADAQILTYIDACHAALPDERAATTLKGAAVLLEAGDDVAVSAARTRIDHEIAALGDDMPTASQQREALELAGRSIDTACAVRRGERPPLGDLRAAVAAGNEARREQRPAQSKAQMMLAQALVEDPMALSAPDGDFLPPSLREQGEAELDAFFRDATEGHALTPTEEQLDTPGGGSRLEVEQLPGDDGTLSNQSDETHLLDDGPDFDLGGP